MIDSCATCRSGCGCGLPDTGCGHYGCYGRHADRSCPGVPAEEARYTAALRARRREDRHRLARRIQLSAAYRTALLSAPGRLSR